MLKAEDFFPKPIQPAGGKVVRFGDPSEYQSPPKAPAKPRPRRETLIDRARAFIAQEPEGFTSKAVARALGISYNNAAALLSNMRSQREVKPIASIRTENSQRMIVWAKA